MNILLVDQFAELGGAQFCLLDLVPVLAERGWSAQAVVPEHGPLVERLRQAGVETHFLGAGDYRSGQKGVMDFARFAANIPRQARSLERLIAQVDAGAVYVNGPRMLPAAAWAAHRAQVPVVYHCHVHLTQATAAWTAGLSLRYAGASVISCCDFSVRPLRRFVPDERVHVVYNGIPEVPRKAFEPDRRRQWRMGVVGRVERDKGQVEFVRAAAILNKEFPDARFAVIGKPLFSGPEYFESARSAARGLPVEFPGWEHDAQQILAGLDLLIVPSMYADSTPRVIMEAFSAGVPVVAFRAGGIPEIVEDELTGFLTAEATEGALAARIRDVLCMDATRLLDVVERARTAWETKYRVERWRRDVAEIIAQSADGTNRQNSNAARTARQPAATRTGG